MNPGRMRYRVTILTPTGARSPMGAVSTTLADGDTLWCDVTERTTTEKTTDNRLTQTRLFDLDLRSTSAISQDAKVRLEYGGETLICAVLGTRHDPRAGTTTAAVAHEVTAAA